MKRLLLLIALCAGPCFAGETAILPEKPQPQQHLDAPVTGREFWIEAGALGTAWTLDTISTHAAFAGSPTRHEEGGLFNGSRSVPKIMGAWAAVDIGAAVAAYEWKKHVKNRYLHPLWRVPMLVGTMGHDRAAIGNFSLGKGIGVDQAVMNFQVDSSTVSGPRVRQTGPSPVRAPRTIQP